MEKFPQSRVIKVPFAKNDLFTNLNPSTKIVVWIDAHVDSPHNKKTIENIKKQIPNVIVETAKTVQEGKDHLKNYALRLIYVIVSGSLCEEYMDNYEQNLRELYIITANIIYCGNKTNHDYKKFAYDKFFNPGGIVVQEKDIIDFIKSGIIQYQEVDQEKDHFGNHALVRDYGFSFNEVKGLPQLAKPCMLGKFLTNEQITEDTYKKFLEQINKYGHPQLNYYSKPNGTVNVKIPYYLNSNFWLKMYSLQTPFYLDVNKDLTHQGGKTDLSLYDPFIFSMYLGLKEGYLQSYNRDIFRGTLMSEEELEGLKQKFKKMKETDKKNTDDISVALCTANSFLSFSKKENIADDFLSRNKGKIPKDKKGKNLKLVKFKIEGLKNKSSSYFISNVVIGELSQYSREEEVLVLPFSCFEIVDIQPDKIGMDQCDITKITLKYLDDLEEKIKEFIKWEGRGKVIEFLNAGSNSNIIVSQSISSYNSFNFFNKKMIVWIDQFANCEKYDKIIKSHENDLSPYQIYKVNSVEKGFNILRMHENKLSYVIVSQYLAEEFFDFYKKNAKKDKLITANIILCENNYKKLKDSYVDKFKKGGFLNDPYLNPGGFVETFDEVLAYIKKDQSSSKLVTSKDKCLTFYDYDTTFIVGNGKDNIREKYLKKYEDPKIIQEDLKSFFYFISKRYDKKKKHLKELNELADPTEEKNILLPAELYATNFMKMYVSVDLPVDHKDNFFTNMNMDLTQNEEKYIQRYLPYIYTIYLGVNAGLVPNYKKKVIRGGCLTEKEIKSLREILKTKKEILVWPKPFLTFFTSEKVADDFLKDYDLTDREDCVKVKFILEEPKEGIFINNMFTGKFSRFKKENQEVVTLPFTPFIIKKIEEDRKKDLFIITMEYDNCEKPSFCKD
ncbi:MAG: hypothetical protein MJ252_00995 [archaeon]|nr:hypothetical protein [archaeon]